MNTLQKALQTLALAALLAVPLPSAQATQIAQTWVASNGVDGNPCTRLQPCATFQGALAKTLPGGQIDVVDSGDYAPVTINQAVTIDGGNAHATIVLTGSSDTAITINTSATQHVTLRHLALSGGTVTNPLFSTEGIRGQSTGLLTVDDCTLTDLFFGIDLVPSASGGRVVIKNTTITSTNFGTVHGSFGVEVQPGPPALNVSLRNVTVQGCETGLDARDGVVDISNSLITQSDNYAIVAGSGSVVNVANCTLSDNYSARYANSDSTIRLTQNNLWNNTFGIDPRGAGIVATAQDNRKAGNTTAGAPTPGKVIAVQ